MGGTSYATATGPLGAEGPYWDALLEDRLKLPRCQGCGAWHWPAVWRCGECGSWDHEWIERPLTGTIFTYTRTHHAFAGTQAFPLPFTTVLVSLTDLPVRLIGVLEDSEAALKIGATVAGRIDRTAFAGHEIPALRWRLAA